jgi:iron complex transport system permease protein
MIHTQHDPRKLWLLGGLILFSLIISLITGPAPVNWQEIRDGALPFIMGEGAGGIPSSGLVFWYVRLPRCLLTILVGAGLAASGCVYQGLFRNPLVSPDILGVSAGATFGAALGLLLPGTTYSLIHILAFLFGLGAVALAMSIARLVAVKPILVLVLAGLVVLSIFNSAITITKFLADPYNELPAVIFWIMGSMSRASWEDLRLAGLVTMGGLVFFHFMRYKLNVLSLGDLQAKSLGVNPGLHRLVFIAISSLMVAISVAVCGQICWVGLVMPHIARTMVGPNHEVMYPVTVLCGALFLLVADTLARSLTSSELPISVVTALLGAPIFAGLLYRNRASGWM